MQVWLIFRKTSESSLEYSFWKIFCFLTKHLGLSLLVCCNERIMRAFGENVFQTTVFKIWLPMFYEVSDSKQLKIFLYWFQSSQTKCNTDWSFLQLYEAQSSVVAEAQSTINFITITINHFTVS